MVIVLVEPASVAERLLCWVATQRSWVYIIIDIIISPSHCTAGHKPPPMCPLYIVRLMFIISALGIRLEITGHSFDTADAATRRPSVFSCASIGSALPPSTGCQSLSASVTA